MQGVRFDTFTCAFINRSTRRAALVTLIGGMVSVLGLAETAGTKGKGKKGKGHHHHHPGSPSPTSGCRPRCTGDQTCKDGFCVCPSDLRFCPDYDQCGECCSSADCCGTYPCPAGSRTCLAGLTCGVSCSDGVQNGSESDVDCGGSECPRCINGRACRSRNDCESRLCDGVRCIACLVDSDCGTDGNGNCYCNQTGTGGAKICRSVTGPYTSCAPCPPGTICDQNGTQYYCLWPCGSV
jgi:hypothetical protein